MNSNPYAAATASASDLNSDGKASTNWFQHMFLVRVILATILSYISLPSVWIVSLVVRDVARDMPLTIRYSTFWQHVFVSKLPVLLLIGSFVTIASLAFIIWRHWAMSRGKFARI